MVHPMWFLGLASVMASDLDLPKPPPSAQSPAANLLRLPGQVIPSSFPVPSLKIPGAPRENTDERTMVKFVTPMQIHLRSIELTDPYRPGWPLRYRIRWFEVNPSISYTKEPKFNRYFGNHGPTTIEAPSEYPFLRGRCHHLGLVESADVNAPGFQVSLEVPHADERGREYLLRNPVIVEFSDEDLQNLRRFSTVYKIYYLPDPVHIEDDKGDTVQVHTGGGWYDKSASDIRTSPAFLAGPVLSDPIRDIRQTGSVLLILRMGIGQIFTESLVEPVSKTKSDEAAHGFLR